MKKIAVLMNTDRNGGAERSMVLQLKEASHCEFTFFIPNVSGSKELENFIEKNINAKIVQYDYPKAIYQHSRVRKFLNFKFIFSVLMLLFKSKVNFSGFDIVYLNGNKAAFYYFLSSFFKKNKKIIWHLRDYFTESKILQFIWKILIYPHRDSLKFISNSHSVGNNLKRSFSNNIDHDVIYNPSGLLKKVKSDDKFETLGVVAMMTPWKGIHEVYFFAWFYEKELRSLGIKKIRLYGDNVYETKGDHSNYKNDLKRMIEKMPTDLIEFVGLKQPETIYGEIDCLIHYSINPEPFGRVIVEAFASEVPVITTGLGGAGEIVEDGVDGLKTILFDRKDLLEKIEKIKNKEIRNLLTKNGKVKLEKIENEISRKIKNLLE